MSAMKKLFEYTLEYKDLERKRREKELIKRQKQIEDHKRIEEEELKQLQQKFEKILKLSKYYAQIRIIDYTSLIGTVFTCVDGSYARVPDVGERIVIPLPNAIPLVKAGIAVIEKIFKGKCGIIISNLCPNCQNVLKEVTVHTFINLEYTGSEKFCEICGFKV